MHRPSRVLLLGTLALAGAACAGGDQSTSPGPTVGQPTTAPAETAPAQTPAASPDASPAASPAASPGASPTGESITITGVEYAFEGVPTSVPVGTALGFDNQGIELHEMAVFRKNDGVTLAFEEILQLPDEEAFTMVTPVGQTFSAPGEMAESQVSLTQEGEHIMLCFIPQGTVDLPTESPDSSPASASPAAASPGASAGPPHFVLGMVQLFEVTEAGSTPGPIASPMAPASPGSSPGTSPEASLAP